MDRCSTQGRGKIFTLLWGTSSPIKGLSPKAQLLGCADDLWPVSSVDTTHTLTAYTRTPLFYETVCTANTRVFCDVTPCSLVERYGSLKRIFCLHHKCNTKCEHRHLCSILHCLLDQRPFRNCLSAMQSSALPLGLPRVLRWLGASQRRQRHKTDRHVACLQLIALYRDWFLPWRHRQWYFYPRLSLS
jgi:hypothetical protein